MFFIRMEEFLCFATSTLGWFGSYYEFFKEKNQIYFFVNKTKIILIIKLWFFEKASRILNREFSTQKLLL